MNLKKFLTITAVLAAAILPLFLMLYTAQASKTVFSKGGQEELERARQISLEILSRQLLNRHIGTIDDLKVEKVEIDELQMAHTRVRQTVNGIPVWEGEAIVHLKADGSLSTITDDLKNSITVNTNPAISADDAARIAGGLYAGTAKATAKPSVSMWIYRGLSRDYLTYRVETQRIDGSNETAIPVDFIDAQTGERVFGYNNLQSGSGSSLYSGTVSIGTSNVGSTFYMENLTRRVGTFTANNGTSTVFRFTDTDDIWNATAQRAGVDAHFGAEATMNYYQTVHNRNGINGSGGPSFQVAAANSQIGLISSIVHYGSNYNNANWNPSGGYMIYGDGDGNLFSPLVALDICGHEFTHGVTQYTANLAYMNESGALNESMSDVFGVMIDRYARPTTWNWQIGEEVYTPNIPGDALRYMDNPQAAGDPDHYSLRLYPGVCTPVESNDYCGVHTNSSITNHAFYLIAAGGTNRVSNITVTGIGPDNAARIWYRALSFYMTEGTTFAQARTATVNAANDLFGSTSTQALTIARGWCAVGVGTCSTGTPTPTVSPTVTPTPSGNTFPGTGVGPIPDNAPNAPLVVSFNVSGVTTNPSNVSVNMTLTHTWVGDLIVTLNAPNGAASRVIYSRVGSTTATGVGDNSNLGGTYVYNDLGGDFWAAATAAAGTDDIIAPGTYRTSAPLTGAATNLTAAFSGLTAAQANGTWTLTFSDNAAADTGTVTAASLRLSLLTPTPTPTITPTPTPTATPTVTPTPAQNTLQDGGFEQNTGTATVSNPFWSSTSTAFVTSFCTAAACGTGAPPRTGNGWVWFDGTGSGTTAENGTVQQSAIIPSGTTTLNYYFRASGVTSPSSSVMTVSVDGTVLQTVTEPATADAAYALRTVNISAFANGASHTIRFAYTRPAGTTGSDNFLVDDVSLSGGTVATNAVRFDFDGDRKADVSVYRPSNGAWYLNQSTAGFVGIGFGISTDKIVPADYDGDGKTDIAVYRPSNGTWYLNRSQLGFTSVPFGIAEDIPAPADFDGDGKADLAVFRPSNGVWYLQRTSAGFTAAGFGQSGDVPVAADYDGDGKADVAVYRPSNGTWYLNRSQIGFTSVNFGISEDKPVPADYDGDGKADVAVFRPSNGNWYLNRSTAGFTGFGFGISSDLPSAADFDGDGKADVAVFRPSNGTWYLNRSQAGFTSVPFGANGDKPIPNAFVP